MKNYLKWPGNNFGDKLNDIIFPSIGINNCIPYNKPNLANLPLDTAVGLGTLLTKKIRSSVTVLGTGADGTRKPNVNLDYKFVRGSLTAKFLGLDHSLAKGDAAYYLKNYMQALVRPKEYKVGIVPHYVNNNELVGSNIISPTLPTNKFIKEISKYEIILAEAMHGAICADILRIPWAPISINQERYPIQFFKWQDWASVFDIDLEFGTTNSYKTFLSTDKQLDAVSSDVRNQLSMFANQ